MHIFLMWLNIAIKKIWLTSPTTLASTLTTIQTIIVNLERDKYAEAIQQELKLLEIEFIRFRERWDKLNNRIDRMTHEIKISILPLKR